MQVINGIKLIFNSFFRQDRTKKQLTEPMIGRIPEEVLLMIFDYLDIHALNHYKRVCKKFYFVIDRMKLKRFTKDLIVKRIGSEEVTNYWFYTYEPILFKNIISSYQIDFLNQPSFIEKFTHIKRFKTNINNEFDVRTLSKMTNLTHLEIDNIINLRYDTKITLKYLRILSIKIFSNYKLIVDSNQLQILKVFKLTNVEVCNPETVTYIEVEYQNRGENLAEYRNLEVYKVKDISRLDPSFMIRSLHTLKSIHFYYPYALKPSLVPDDIESVLQKKNDQILYKNLKVYYQGIEIVNEQTAGSNFMSIELMKRCYDRSEKTLEWFSFIDYKELVQQFDTFPSDFQQKFINIQSIRLNAPKLEQLKKTINQDELASFLENCSKLSSIELIRPAFDENFYEKLTFRCPLLKSIVLVESNEISLNYRFILSFKSLKSFSTTHNLLLNEAVELLTRSSMCGGVLNEMFFEFENKPIRLDKFKSKEIYTIWYKNKRFTFKNNKLSTDFIPKFFKSVDKEIQEKISKRY